MIGEILQLAGQYFVSSFEWVWGLIVTLLTVGLWILWLFVGGALSLPVLVRVAGWVTKKIGHIDPVPAMFAWTFVPVVFLVYAYLWAASAVWLNHNVFGIPEGTEHFGVWSYVMVLFVLVIVGIKMSWKWALEE